MIRNNCAEENATVAKNAKSPVIEHSSIYLFDDPPVLLKKTAKNSSAQANKALEKSFLSKPKVNIAPYIEIANANAVIIKRLDQ
jgi:hypothetical protein